MNIAISTLVNSGINNGLNRYAKYLIEAIQEIPSDHSYYIIVNEEYSKEINIWADNCHKIVVRIPNEPRIFTRPAYYLWQNILAHKIIKKNNIQVFHLLNPIPLFNKFGIPFIVTIHDVAEFSVKRYARLRQSFRKAYIKRIANKADKIITVSEFSKNEISEKFKLSSERIDVTYLGPGITLMNSDLNAVNDNNQYLLVFASDQPYKNTKIVINAFLQLQLPNLELKLIGSSKIIRKLQYNVHELINQGVRILEAPSNEELIQLYLDSTCLVYPSKYEGFGLPIMEAMSLGVTVVSSEIPVIKEVAGDTIYYFDINDIESLKKQIMHIINAKAITHKKRKEARVRSKNFNWKNTAIRTIQAYESLG